jgi:hypothetical protein
MLKVSRTIFFFAALFACLPTPAQVNNVGITGQVTDSVGAVVAGVQIVVRRAGTNVNRTVQTNESGVFAITNLSPGAYDLTGQMTGFTTYKLTGLTLEVGQMRRVDIQLQVGEISQSVDVTAEVAALNTDRGAVVGSVIEQREIQELPLESRSIMDLALLVPGVLPQAEGGLGSGINTGGARSETTNFYVDGIGNREPRTGGAAVSPNADAVQEFKMDVSGYSADQGRYAGGSMSVALRTGTNKLHGTVYEFVRNNVIDARAFFDQQKLKLNRHQYGTTLHGPVVLPKIYNGHDRTFFLFSWEGNRQLVGRSSLGLTPLLTERGGDFSQSRNSAGALVAVRDPLANNTPFPGNRIPENRIHPVSTKMLPFYPLPNRASTSNNFITAANQENKSDQFLWKIDHRLNEANTLSFRHMITNRFALDPFVGGQSGAFPGKTDAVTSLASLNYTHLFSPAFLVESRFGFSRTNNLDYDASRGVNVAAELGLPVWNSEPQYLGWPRVNLLGYITLASLDARPVDFQTTGFDTGAVFTLSRGTHIRKWGVDILRDRFNQPFPNGIRGIYTIQQNWTGHAMGDFLLGMLQNTSRRVSPALTYMRGLNMSLFFNDDWKVTPRLTVNLGVRYELVPPYKDRYGRMYNYVPELGKIVVASPENIANYAAMVASYGMQNKVVAASEVGLPSALVNTDYNNLAPRLGVAWRPFGHNRMVVRAGYGIFYTGQALARIRTYMMTSFPVTAEAVSYSRLASRTDLMNWSNPFPTELSAVSGFTSGGMDINSRTGYMQNYNFTVERDLGGGTVLEVGFVGSKGTNLARTYNWNQPRRSVSNYLNSVPLNNTRPDPVLSTMVYFSFNSNSNYNAGQIQLRKRARGGAFYRLGYSFGKAIDEASQASGGSTGGFSYTGNATAIDPDNLRLERGRADFDRTHALTAAYSLPLPVGKGKRLASNVHGVASGFISGWQFSGTASVASGSPITPSTSNADENLGQSLRPNRVGEGLWDTEQPGKRGVDYSWFDKSVFPTVPRCISVAAGCPVDQYGFLPFAKGNSGRNLFDGPSLIYLNMAMLKNFRFGEGKNVQFRLESFNIMNHANFRIPNKSVDTVAGGFITSVAATGAGGPRVFQAALKLYF